MAICPVCGCKTQDIDFTERTFYEQKIKICSFCDKQLKKAESGDFSTAQKRWIDAAVSKDVPGRDEVLKENLYKLKSKCDENTPPEESIPMYPTAPAENIKDRSQNDNIDITLDKNYVYALETRVKKLEAEISRFKKMQIIKTVLEIVIPIMLAIILLIIFFSSGIMDYFSQLQDITDMMSGSVTPAVFKFFGGI